MLSITLIKAPIPAAFAEFGFEFCHTNNKTKPATGMKNPKIPQQILIESVLSYWLIISSFNLFLHDEQKLSSCVI